MAVMADTEQLGEVTAPSGIVVVLDMGLMWLWSHDRAPTMPAGRYDPETVAAANSQADFELVGPGAEPAGVAFDHQADPRYLCDIPRHGWTRLRRKFNRFVRTRGLDARLARLKQRLTHRARVARAVARGGAGGVQFQGIWAAAAGGVPADRALRVLGEARRQEPYAGRWHQVWLECRPGGRIARSEKVYDVMVDEARLLFGDADALGSWRHDEPLDGRADFVFWGSDAPRAARRLRAPAVPGEDGTFGWLGLPAADAGRRGARVVNLRGRTGWQLATDYRPHSHHWEVMRQVRASPTSSGTVRVGGARVCGLMTSWGDGIYPVFRDLDRAGRLVRLRVELGGPETVRRVQRVEERWFGPLSLLAIVTARVWEEGRAVRWLYRAEPHNERDSGWRVFAGDEAPGYADDPRTARLVPLRELIDRDRGLEEVFRSPPGTAFERRRLRGPFTPVAWQPEED
jgi:hypothetical protein